MDLLTVPTHANSSTGPNGVRKALRLVGDTLAPFVYFRGMGYYFNRLSPQAYAVLQAANAVLNGPVVWHSGDSAYLNHPPAETLQFHGWTTQVPDMPGQSVLNTS